jgi:transglutaminase-like putative cysteine protease
MRRYLGRLGELVLCAALTGCAGLSLHRAVEPRYLLPVVAVAATVPAVAVALWSVRARPLSLWLAAPASAASWLLVVTATVLHGRATAGLLPNPATLGATGSGLRDGWREVLAVILPVGAAPGVLVAVHGLVWLAGYVAAETVARTRSGLGALAPPLVVLVAGLLAGVGAPGSNGAVVVGFIALGGLLLLVRARGRGYLAGTALVAAVTLMAALVGPRLPVAHGRPPLDLRRYVQPASQPQPALDPLDQVSAWLATPDARLFTVVAPNPQDWRVAVLDRFDGTTWSTTGRFAPTGSRVPAPAVPPAHPVRVTQHVTIDGLTGVWLPAAASPVVVTGVPVVVDPATGVLLSRTGLYPGLSYDVTSVVPDDDPEQLLAAVPAADAEARAGLRLPPGLPDALPALAQRATDGAAYPFQQATRLEAYLRDTGRYDPTAPPGHSYGHLAYFLAVTHRGTSEQFATAFAVLARTLGLPSRVVVGFRAGTPTDRGWLVQGSDALVWPEVDFEGLGWVAFFPTPNTAATATSGDQAPAGSTSRRQQIDAGINAAPPPAPAPSTGTRGPVRPRSGADNRLLWTVVALAPLGLVVGYLLLVLLVPALGRRHRRRARDGTALVAGAWQQALFALRPAGLAGVRALTTGEVAALGARRLGDGAGEHLYALAALADAAGFSGVALDRSAGEQAWRHVDAIAAAVRGAVGPRTVLRYRLGPAALRRGP